MTWRDQNMWEGRHCREGERSEVEIIGTKEGRSDSSRNK
jgi:hypothetical protein